MFAGDRLSCYVGLCVGRTTLTCEVGGMTPTATRPAWRVWGECWRPAKVIELSASWLQGGANVRCVTA